MLVLLGLHDEILGSLSFLLGNLLELYSVGELLTKSHLGDGDIINNNLEVLGTVLKSLADHKEHLFSLGEQLAGIVLSDDRSDCLINNRGEHTLIVVSAQ